MPAVAGTAGPGPQPQVQAPGWVADLLNALKAPISAGNVSKLEAWNACEGNATGGSGLPINNPFNTTLSGYGGSSVNSAGVKHYPSWSGGLQATIDTLQANRYKSVVTNLQQDGPGGDFATAVGSSGWGTSGSCIAGKVGNATNGGTPAGGAGTTGAGGAGPSGCAIHIPSFAGIGGGCLITNSNLKAIKGGLLVWAGGGVFAMGVLVLAAYGFQRSGAAKTASKALKVTPVGKVARAANRTTGGATSRTASPRTTPASSTPRRRLPDRDDLAAQRATRDPGPTRQIATYRAAARGTSRPGPANRTRVPYNQRGSNADSEEMF
jgi:hypothetical protein